MRAMKSFTLNVVSLTLTMVLVVIMATHDGSTKPTSQWLMTTKNFTCEKATESDCKLEDVIKNFTQVNMYMKKYTMDKKMMFSSLENVSVNGNGVIIDCQRKSNTIMIFDSVVNLNLQGITFTQCGGRIKLPNTSDDNRHFFGALAIKNSSNVKIREVKIMQSNGGGLYLGSVGGIIDIINCVFTENPQDPSCCQTKRRYGGGVYLDQLDQHDLVSSRSPETYITFTNCSFTHNSIKYSTHRKIDRRYTNHGGGMYASIKVPGNYIKVNGCVFENNTAGYGGGLSITHSNCSYNSTVIVTSSNFSNNTAKDTLAQHGGGLYLLLQSPLDEYNCTQNRTTLKFENLEFKYNLGWIGGGFGIVAFCQEQEMNIIVVNCYWKGNKARSGAAMSLTRAIRDKGQCHSLPHIAFQSCTFEDNVNKVYPNSISNDDDLFYLEGWTGPGVFFVIYFNVNFMGEIVFRNNVNTALTSINCIVYFKYATVTFIDNHGNKGGAIALEGLTHLSLTNSNLSFINNTALVSGGAIHNQLLVEATMIMAASCFIQIKDNDNISGNNSTLTFNNNSANFGNSIYVTSLIPCQISFGIENHQILKAKQVLINDGFIFENSNLTDQVSTAAAKIELKEDSYQAFPGKRLKIQFKLKDDLNNTASSKNFQFEISLNGLKQISSTTGSTVTVKGEPGQDVTLQIMSQRNPHISKNVTVHLTDCPLGYQFNDSEQICECAINDSTVVKCKKRIFSLQVMKEHYIGLVDDTVVVSYCYNSFCNVEDSKTLQGKNASQLEKLICNEHRKGTLCGECIDGYTVYYNSPNFVCKEETDLCDIGWFFYILTTFIPLTLIFIIITAFNINLTFGSLRGFLLFCQVVVILDSSNMEEYKIPQMIWKGVYDIFRLRFFYMDPLSFCIKKDATVLDVLALQYIATVYALGLVCISILWISYCTVYFNRCCSCLRITTLKYSFVTGFSALLILCYASMATISMNLLNTATLYHNEKQFGEVRVNVQGNIVYFSKEHLPYAIPATIILLTIVVAPIILFLSCPLINKCFDYFNFTNSNPASRLASQCYLGGKFKPFYDMFQGCFKEKAQFFAGMYFLYQIMVIISKIYPTTREQTFFHTTLTLILILAIHSLVHPYKKRRHNIIDTLLFTNLLIINSLSYYIYLAQINPDAHFNTMAAKAIQTILIFLPMIIFTVAIFRLICQKLGVVKRVRSNTLRHRYYRDRRTSSMEVKTDLAYGAFEDERDLELSVGGESEKLDVSVRKRQFSLSNFIAHEQMLLPADSTAASN